MALYTDFFVSHFFIPFPSDNEQINMESDMEMESAEPEM